MPGALVHVMQKIDGIPDEKQTTWAVKQVVNNNGSGTLDDPTIALFIGPRLAAGDTSFVTAALPGANLSVVEAIANFHYHQQGTNVKLTRIVVNDGKTPGVSRGPRGIVPLNLTCSSSRSPGFGAITANDSAAANIALNLVKTPIVSSVTPGRLFLRCAVRASQVIAGDKDGATIHPGELAAYQSAIDLGLAASRVKQFFLRPVGAVDYFQIGQAQYYNVLEQVANPALKGVLKIVQAISKIVLENAKPHQVIRGKRKKTSASTIARQLVEWGVEFDAPALATKGQPSYGIPDNGQRPGLAEAEQELADAEAWIDLNNPIPIDPEP